MNNLQWFHLQHEIKDAMAILAGLQTQYRAETGVKFISGQVIKDPKFCDTCYFLGVLGLYSDDPGLRCCCEDSEFFEKQHPVYGCGEHEETEANTAEGGNLGRYRGDE